MFDSFVFFALLILAALVLGPVGFFMTLGLRGRLARAEQRVAELEARLATRSGIAAPSPSAAPVPETPQEVQAPPPAPAAPPVVATPAEMPPPEAPLPPPPPITPQPVSVPQIPPAAAGAEPPAEPPSLSPPRSLEETLGTRWTVWVGGIALALGGLLLVRYSIEQGWLGPAARIIAGFVFAALLIVAGEVLRRRGDIASAAGASAQIPSILTAAGTVSAFGTVYAAHALYHFIGPAIAFLLLGVLGLATMLAAALQAPWLAGLGLIGAFVAPLLVTTREPSAWPAVIYVCFVTAAAYGLARLKLWFWLALAAAAGGLVWGIALLYSTSYAEAAAPVFHALLQTLLAVALFVVARQPGETASAKDVDGIGVAVPSAFALLMFFALSQSVPAGAFGPATLAMAVIAAAALAVAGLAFARAAALLISAALLGVAILLTWPTPPNQLPEIFPWDDLPAPQDAAGFAIFAFSTIPVLALAATARLLRRPDMPNIAASLTAAAGTLAPLAALAVAYQRLHHGETSNLFAALAAGLAFLFLIAASLFQSRRQQRLEGEEAGATYHLGLGAYAAATLAALAFGLVFALDRGTLTIALALAALGAAFVDRRLDIAALRWGVAILGGIVALRLFIDPRIVGTDLGTTPIFNWLLWGYGIPALAFAAAAELMRPRGEDRPVDIAQGLAILFAAFLVFFEIRHAIHGGDPFAPGTGLVEQGLMTTAAFAYALLLTRLDARHPTAVLRAASLALGLISVALALIGLIIVFNPLFRQGEVEGGRVVNALLLGYALPAGLAFFLARAARGVRPTWYVTATQASCHALAFAYLNLELRRLLHGADLSLFGLDFNFRMSDTEVYAYSALWLGLGILYLSYGLVRHSAQARLVSAVLVVASVVKVFLLDLAGLHGILRALSFIGLGLVLMAVGLVYQKFVFSRRAPRA